MADWTGRRALVTGAASGIGRATVRRLVREGARVALLDRDAEGLAASIEAAGGGMAIPVDLADPAAIAPAVARAGDALGGLDGVVNCAGISGLEDFDRMPLDHWSRVIAINLTAPFLVCQAAVALLREGNAPAIVNVASGAALVPDSPRTTAYAASKGGLVSFSKALAAELAPGVRVNAVCPGLTATPMVGDIGLLAPAEDGSTPPRFARYALKRAADPDEIAAAIQFLLGPDASYVTATTLAADGGRTFH